MRRFRLIADDYGLSPGVDDAILDLLKRGRLSGTGCMCVFPQWEASVRRMLDEAPAAAEIGLHLTLTDQPALTGCSALAPDGRLLTHGRLLGAIALGTVTGEHIAAELDAQLTRFRAGFGREPDFVDGHQHVHFLKPVRIWLAGRAASLSHSTWLRGAPAPDLLAPKPSVVRLLAKGFETGMRRAGYFVRGPLFGFYDWRSGNGFLPMLRERLPVLPDGAVMMVHPGRVDQVLRGRDSLTDARETEHDVLGSDVFGDLLESNKICISRRQG